MRVNGDEKCDVEIKTSPAKERHTPFLFGATPEIFDSHAQESSVTNEIEKAFTSSAISSRLVYENYKKMF